MIRKFIISILILFSLMLSINCNHEPTTTQSIYMAGEGNTYGHPHEETIEAINEIGALIYGTDVNRTIIVTTNSEAYSTQT